MVESNVGSLGTLGLPGEVCSRHAQKRMHDKVVDRSDGQEERDLVCPDGEWTAAPHHSVARDRADVVNQTQLSGGEALGRRWREETQLWERELLGFPPDFDFSLDLWSPFEIWPRERRAALVLRRRIIVVVTTTVVLCAVAALRKSLVTADMASLAGFAAVPRLGMTATRGSSSWAGHGV
jgi:hypothetical protein